jgi:hypothetical protein
MGFAEHCVVRDFGLRSKSSRAVIRYRGVAGLRLSRGGLEDTPF